MGWVDCQLNWRGGHQIRKIKTEENLSTQNLRRNKKGEKSHAKKRTGQREAEREQKTDNGKRIFYRHCAGC